jgi:hypothetical protein
MTYVVESGHSARFLSFNFANHSFRPKLKAPNASNLARRNPRNNKPVAPAKITKFSAGLFPINGSCPSTFPAQDRVLMNDYIGLRHHRLDLPLHVFTNLMGI